MTELFTTIVRMFFEFGKCSLSDLVTDLTYCKLIRPFVSNGVPTVMKIKSLERVFLLISESNVNPEFNDFYSVRIFSYYL